MEQFLTEANNKFSATLDHLRKELSSVRAGRANPSLIEEMPVDAYGTKMKLMEIASIAAPQPSLLAITVWDPGLVKSTEKAILESTLGLTPNTDGQTIRLNIPPLSEERRLEFVKVAHAKGEDARIAIRQIRGDERDAWEKAKESGEIGEDELFRREKLLQDLVDKVSAQVAEFVKLKEEELTTL
jgi:ribosome recycling factor